MNSRFVKWAALALAVALCCTAMIGCKGKNGGAGSNPDASQDVALYPTKPTDDGNQPTATVPVLTDSKQDWSVFSAMGVSEDEAETVFMTLGFAELSEPKANGDGSYTVYPYGAEETPLLVKTAEGKITHVVLSNLHVADGAKNAYHNDGELPGTWYAKGDNGYTEDSRNIVTVLMYDTANDDSAYVVGVDWDAKQLIYF